MASLAPSVAAIRLAVRAALTAELGPVELGAVELRPAELGAAATGGVLVACSGGADSLALAAAAAFVGPRIGVPVGLVTVDHGLQAGSQQRAADVAAWANAAGLGPVEIAPVDVAGRRGGPEAAAREARYAALTEAGRRHGASVLLGHTRDDQAETVLLALARGSGPRGLAGMPARRDHGGVVLPRPLPPPPRADTRAACAAQGLTPWVDPHNSDARYARARVRADALPALVAALGPAVVDNLARTAAQLAADTELLDAQAATALAAARVPQLPVPQLPVPQLPVPQLPVPPGAAPLRVGLLRPDAGCDGLSVQRLAVLPPAIRTRVLHAWARELGAPGAALSHRHVAALDALVTGWHGQGAIALPGGIAVSRILGVLHRVVGL